MNPPLRQVRAVYDADTITVYQAYSSAIADAAIAAGTFVAPFDSSRMTWIKPSFLWMMYRSGWSTKPGQERVLAIRMVRPGFEEALSMSCLSHFDPKVYDDYSDWEQRMAESPVRVQWDPERSVSMEPLPWRSLQVGLGGGAVRRYVDDWIVGLDDVTSRVRELRRSEIVDASNLPDERPYVLPEAVARIVGATTSPLELA